MRKVIYVSILILFVTGCATTNVKTHVNPEFDGKKYTTLLVDAPNASFEYKELLLTSFCDEMASKNVKCHMQETIFPPIKKYTVEEKLVVIDKYNIDGFVIFSVLANREGMLDNGHPTDSTLPKYSHYRSQSYQISLIDVQSATKAFVMEARTSADGSSINSSDSIFVNSLIGHLVSEMDERGYF